MNFELVDVLRLYNIMKRLRGPGGCPWDQEQSIETLKPCLLEETYELLDVMSGNNMGAHVEELGDVLLQVVFQCAIREEQGEFSFNDVAASLSDKLVRRHPHVFGSDTLNNSTAVLKSWEAIKREERGVEPGKSVLDGVPQVLPALLKAQRIQEKAARTGFDWREITGVKDKVVEELNELTEAEAEDNSEHVKEEIGDLLFAIVNLCRFLKVDAESALEASNKKFITRFQSVERSAASMGKNLAEMSLPELDALWDIAKKQA